MSTERIRTLNDIRVCVRVCLSAVCVCTCVCSLMCACQSSCSAKSRMDGERTRLLDGLAAAGAKSVVIGVCV